MAARSQSDAWQFLRYVLDIYATATSARPELFPRSVGAWSVAGDPGQGIGWEPIYRRHLAGDPGSEREPVWHRDEADDLKLGQVVV
jgi:hypothetical protein